MVSVGAMARLRRGAGPARIRYVPIGLQNAVLLRGIAVAMK